MFFTNLTFFRFPASFSGLFPTPLEAALDDLERHLGECQLKPIGALELHTRGFVSPLGRNGEQLTHRIGACTWITLGGEDKILPGSVINDLLQKRIQEIEEKEGRKLGGRARKRMKEDLVHELLPRAFAKPGRCDAYFDFNRHFIAVDTTSRARAEQVVSEIRHATGSFPALPLSAQTAIRTVLTSWVAGNELPHGFTLCESCELRGLDEMRVTIRNIELGGNEISAHLEAGLQCTRLALKFEDRLAFEVDESLTVRKLIFLDGCLDELENSVGDDYRAELDARFTLMSGEIGRLFDALDAAFKFQAAGDEPMRTTGQTHSRQSIAAEPARHSDVDPMYELSVKLVTETQQVSIASLQRWLKIGYNRAARLVESMEASGVVSSPEQGGHRRVLARGTTQ